MVGFLAGANGPTCVLLNYQMEEGKDILYDGDTDHRIFVFSTTLNLFSPPLFTLFFSRLTNQCPLSQTPPLPSWPSYKTSHNDPVSIISSISRT